MDTDTRRTIEAMLDGGAFDGHTPGPWAIEFNCWPEWVSSIGPLDSTEYGGIDGISGGNDDATLCANHKLAAAAPDLLAYARELRAELARRDAAMGRLRALIQNPPKARPGVMGGGIQWLPTWQADVVSAARELVEGK